MKQCALIAIVLLPAILGSVDQWKIGYKQGYDYGKWNNKAHDEDFTTEVDDFCTHHGAMVIK